MANERRQPDAPDAGLVPMLPNSLQNAPATSTLGGNLVNPPRPQGAGWRGVVNTIVPGLLPGIAGTAQGIPKVSGWMQRELTPRSSGAGGRIITR